MSERLTRKEIKRDIREDEVALFINRAFEWMGENRQTLIRSGIGLAALLVAAVAGGAFVGHQREAASEALQQALETLTAPVVAVAEDAGPEDAVATPDAGSDLQFASAEARRAAARESLGAVGTGLGSGASGDVANLLLADIAAAEGQADDARALWQGFADNHEGHMLAVVARLNLIGLARQQGQGEALVDDLRGELEGGRPSLPEDMLLWELARTLEDLGRDEEAKTYYQQIVDEHTSSPYANEARQRTADTAA